MILTCTKLMAHICYPKTVQVSLPGQDIDSSTLAREILTRLPSLNRFINVHIKIKGSKCTPAYESGDQVFESHQEIHGF